MDDLTVIAVDWSGAKDPAAQRRGVWVAVVEGGELAQRRDGWSREAPTPQFLRPFSRP